MMPDDFEGTLPPTELAPDNLLLEWTARIRSGETGPEVDGLARYVIQDFCMRLWRNEAQSDTVLHWIADVLTKILDDGKPDARRAFSLLAKPSHRAESTDLRLDIATWVNEAMARNYSKTEATKLAAATFERDEKSIRRDIKGLEAYPRIYPARIIEEVFKQQHKPLPAAKTNRTRTR